MKKAFFYCVLILLPFVIMEGFFRILPVSNPPYLLPVSAAHPVVHYQPNIEYLSSGGWNFSIRTRMRTNNFGYNNLWDYHPEDTTPLLMVIGDSFVEALTVDSGKSTAEILNSTVSGRGRVYSIGVSGAALSQYLAFAEFSKNSFHPSVIAFFLSSTMISTKAFSSTRPRPDSITSRRTDVASSCNASTTTDRPLRHS
jgi:hypothetical protein